MRTGERDGAERISRRQLQGYLDKLSREEPGPEPKLRQATSQFGLDLEALLAGAERQHVRRDLVTYRDLDFYLLSHCRASHPADPETSTATA